MTSRLLRLAMTLATALLIAAPAFATEKRHQLIEPIQPDRRQKEKDAGPAPAGKLCYCRTVHERNAAGRLTWKVVCSEKGPSLGARKVYARDCRELRGLPPS